MSPVLLLLLAGAPARALSPVLSWDLEDNDAGCISGGDLLTWEWGAPLAGPTAAYSGSRVWGTILDGLYLRDVQATLVLGPADLTGISEPVLVLQQWLDLADGDVARIEVDRGAGFQVQDPIYGYDGDLSLVGTDEAWKPLYLDLAGLSDLSQVRLVLASNAGRAYGWYVDDLAVYSGDAVPPDIRDVTVPELWSRFDLGPSIQAAIRDDRSLTSLALVWRLETGGEQTTGFHAQGDGRWEATLPPVPPGTLQWHIEAGDGTNIATWPTVGEAALEVGLPAPQDLAGPTDRAWGTTVPLSWRPPDSDEPVLQYQVYRDGELVAEGPETSVQAPALGLLDSFTVSALFDTVLGEYEGALAGPVTVDVAVPVLTALSPDTAWQGDTLRVEVSGSALLLDATATQAPNLYLGPGVVVTQVQVENVDRATFTVEVAADSPVGARTAALTTSGVAVSLGSAFTVLDGDARPALLSVSPAALTQGTRDTLVLSLTAAPAGVPTVDLGEGVVVEAVRVDGTRVEADVAVANDAALGTRAVTVDDGVRILTLADGFRVWTQSQAIHRGCSSLPGGRAPLSLAPLLGLLLLRRRQPRQGRPRQRLLR